MKHSGSSKTILYPYIASFATRGDCSRCVGTAVLSGSWRVNVTRHPGVGETLQELFFFFYNAAKSSLWVYKQKTYLHGKEMFLSSEPCGKPFIPVNAVTHFRFRNRADAFIYLLFFLFLFRCKFTIIRNQASSLSPFLCRAELEINIEIVSFLSVPCHVAIIYCRQTRLQWN